MEVILLCEDFRREERVEQLGNFDVLAGVHQSWMLDLAFGNRLVIWYVDCFDVLIPENLDIQIQA